MFSTSDKVRALYLSTMSEQQISFKVESAPSQITSTEGTRGKIYKV